MMKYFKVCISSLILLFTGAASAIELSLNQSQFIPGDNLIVTLTEDWSGEADIYVVVTLPGDETLFFLTASGFVIDLIPYARAQVASGSREVFRITELPETLPTGEYIFYAAVTVPDTIEIIGEIVHSKLIFATEPVEVTFDETPLPDGVIGRTYSFAIEPETGTPPYKFSLSSGSLPDGLTLGGETGLIQGEPSVRGVAEFTVQVVDAGGNVGEFEGAIKVFGVLSFGEHGTFKGCNGLQMAINSAQDLDEIRIEKGTYECNGLEIPSSKTFEHGIKVSGGWDSGFVSQSDSPAVTVLDGKEEGRILSLSAAGGAVAIEGLSFQNGNASSEGGAINGNGKVSITNCVFSNNSGGAVYFYSPPFSVTITNSTFTNNSGRAVSFVSFVTGYNSYSSSVTISNSTFTNNSDGAVSSVSYAHFSGSDAGRSSLVTIITNSTFTNNNASEGGAVYSLAEGSRRAPSFSLVTITNSTFANNNASKSGGAIYSEGVNFSYLSSIPSVSSSVAIISSTFTNNTANYRGGAVSSFNEKSSISITNSTFTKNSARSGGAVYSSEHSLDVTVSISNSTFTNNTEGGAIYGMSAIVNSTIANNNGGGFYGGGIILNTIFAENKIGEEATDITPYNYLHMHYTLVNNISGAVNFGTHIIMGDPRFVDAENGDFHLRSDSPAINVGDSTLVNACSEYNNCDSSCQRNCDDSSSEECKKTCCQCSRYTYHFLRNDKGELIDLDGNPRIVGGAIDLGVFEVQ